MHVYMGAMHNVIGPFIAVVVRDFEGRDYDVVPFLGKPNEDAGHK